MNGAQALLTQLQQHNIHTLFGYPGGCIMPLYDALLDSPIKHVLCRHEQAAALAADGYARASGEIGVCIATSGPGATNLITGVANAFMDSIPMLVITGQVPSQLMGTDAFQEADILGMTLGIVKHSYLITDASSIPQIIEEAINIATSGRPGPVWLDIPKDILLNEATTASWPSTQTTTALPNINETNFYKALKLLHKAQKPLIYSGGGIMAASAEAEFKTFYDSLEIPQVVTLKGVGNTGKNNNLNLGMLGMHGSRAANEAVAECDLLLAIGVRFDDRATGKVSTFAPNAKIIHMDIDASEFNKNKKIDVALRGNLKSYLQRFNQEYGKPLSIDTWRNHCANLKQTKGFKAWTDTYNFNNNLDGPTFLKALDQQIEPETLITCDVGQHQMWVAQYMEFEKPRHHLSSGGLGTMGYGLPAAIGASFTNNADNNNAHIINISGDGSFMMNLQELATIKRYNLPIKIIILDNQKLGMVRQQQELFYQQRYSEIDLSDNPPFTDLANTFGIPAYYLDNTSNTEHTLKEFLAHQSSALLHVRIASDTNVWPMVKPGASNSEMIEQNPTYEATP